MKIKVGSVTEEFVGDEKPSDLDAYVAVDVTLNGKGYSVGCSIGIRPSEQGLARASGALSTYGGGPDAWWEDAADRADLPDGCEDEVLEALNKAAPRLWNEVEELRECATEDSPDSVD